MNCPICKSGFLERAGELEIAKMQTGEIKVPNFPITIYICSVAPCSHVELRAGGEILRDLKKVKQEQYLLYENK